MMRSNLAIRPTRVIALIAALPVAVALGGCSSSSKTSSPTTTASTPSSTVPISTAPATTSTTTPSAATSLERFFAASAQVDQRLKVAASAVNGAIGTTQVTVDQATLDAIDAANPSSAANAIPAGLTPSVLLPVLTVHSDLVSRYYSLRGFRLYLANPSQPRTIPITDPQVHPALVCLGEGHGAASSFAADVAAAQTAASGAPPVAPVDPASQTAGTLAVQLEHTVLLNEAGAGCGGTRVTGLTPVTWHHVDPLPGENTSWDGDEGGLLFAATYKGGEGWSVVFHGN